MPRPFQSTPDTRQDDNAQRIHDTLAHRPGFLIRRLHQIHVAIFFEECAEFNITPVQYSVMTALQSGELDQKALANSVGIDRTTTAEVLKRLEASGLLSRSQSPEDKRRRIASLTKQGRDLIDRMEAPAQRAHDRTVAPLNDADRERFLSLVTRLVDASNDYGRAPMKFP